MINFKVPRTKNSIIIDIKNWVQNSSQILTVHRLSGRPLPTYIAKVLEVNEEKENLKGVVSKGDTVLLSRVASEVAQFRAFEVEVGDKRYYDVPIMQVLGVFLNGVISFNSFNPILDKIVVKKLDTTKIGALEFPDNQTMIGKVIKVGSCRFDQKWNKHELNVKVGDTVLIKDNVTTEISLDGNTYYVTEESMVVGVFNSEKYNLENIKFLNKSIIMESYIPPMALNSTLLTPSMNFEAEDITSIYNRDLFKIVALDQSLTNLKKDDIIL